MLVYQPFSLRWLLGVNRRLFFFVFIINALLSISAWAAVPDVSIKQLPHSYADAVKLAAPAVVNIYTLRQPELHIQRSQPNLQRDRQRYRLGSGVIVNKDGYILTNHHLIQQAKNVLIALDDGRRATAKVIGNDPQTDLTILKVNINNLQPIQLGNSDKIEVGDIVLAIGNPFGLGQTVTQGIISAIGRSMIGINELENYIQTDAAINPGNSGGALINTEGKLIGINTAIYTRSGGYQGVGFAIPVNVALNVMNQIIKFGVVKRGWLGIEIRDLSAALAKSLGVEQTSGVIIMRVLPQSPAAKFGLKLNDIITRVNNQRIRNSRGFASFVAQLKPGTTIQLSIIRNKKIEKVSVKIGIRPSQPTIDRQRIPNSRYPQSRQRRNDSNSKQKQPYFMPDQR